MSRSGFSRHDLAMVVVSLIWGANFSANKYALGAFGPLAFAATRFLIASGLLWALVKWLSPGHPLPARAAWRLAGLGVIGNTGYQALFMTGLVTTTAINASLIMAALPIGVAVLATLSGVEKPGPRLWGGIGIATLGVAIVIAAQGISFSSATLRGDLLILLAAFCWAAFTVGIRHVGRGLDPLRVTAVSTLGGTPGLVVAAIPEVGRTDWLHLPGGAILALVYSSVFSLVVAYYLWSHAVAAIGGSRTALYNCVVPVFAALVAWLVLGERPLPAQFAGAALVFAGVFLSQARGTPALRPPVSPEP
jgi:drug/metabolite transporter (DMT)-like permease